MFKYSQINVSSYIVFSFNVTLTFLVVFFGSSIQVFADEEKQVEKPQRKGIPVEVVPVKKQTIRAIVYGQGTARAVRREFLSFETEGKIKFIKKGKNNRDLAAGDLVKKGELLASVDKRSSIAELGISQASVEQAKQKKTSAQADFNKAKASVLKAQSGVSQARAGINKAQADVNKAKAEHQVAVAELKRTATLVKKQVLPRQDLERSQATAKQAEAAVRAATAGLKAALAEVESALSGVQSARSGVTSAASSIKAADSGISSAKAQQVKPTLGLEDTSIFSPMDGIVSFLNIKEGQYFSKQRVNSSSEEAALETTPIVIIDPSEFEIILDLPTFQGIAVKPGQKVYTFTGELLGNVELNGLGDLNAVKSAIKGEVFSVSPAINPGGRSIQIKVRTKPEKNTIHDGMFVNCWLVVKEHSDAIVVPYNVIMYEGKKTFVFVFNKDTGSVERRLVTRGIRGLNGVEIIDGLKVGEQVIGKGHNRLTHGTQVEVVVVRGEK